MKWLFWITSLAIRKFFPVTDFCSVSILLIWNLHFSAMLLALLSASDKFDRDVFHYINKLWELLKQVSQCIIDFGCLNGKFCSWTCQIPCFSSINGFHTSHLNIQYMVVLMHSWDQKTLFVMMLQSVLTPGL